MLKTIIIDDEFMPRELLDIKIRDFCPDLIVVGKADSAQQGYEMCKILKPDLVFLDVNMPNESGFDFIKKFEQIDFEVIFATAHHEFAIQAFNVSAIGYLLKPIEDNNLIDVVNSAIKHVSYKQASEKYSNLIHTINKKDSVPNKLVVPASEKYEIINISDILFLEGTDKYTNIHVKDGRKILSSNYIGKYKSMLENCNFFVSHKSFIVNIDFVKSVSLDDEIHLSTGHIVPLARRRKVEFMEIIAR